MTEQEWLVSVDPAAMLAAVRGPYRELATGDAHISDRKLRLFACAGCRQVWPLLADPRSRRAVEVAERFADSLPNETLRAVAIAHAASAHLDATRGSIGEEDVAAAALRCITDGYLYPDRLLMPSILPHATQAALLRCVVGNPFRTYAWTDCHRCDCTPGPYQFLDKQWLAWRGGTVPALARHIYDERDWSALPVLADVLEEAGCGDADILGHCRGDGGACRGCYAGATWCEVCGGTGRLPVAHGRGCWCVDLILGLS